MSFDIDLDMPLFIAEVRARPPIWDMDSPDYANKRVKDRCWDEVGFAVYPGFEEANDQEKLDISKYMRRRWRSLRDCYTRELNVTKTRKSTAAREKSKRKKYVYFDKLHFIRPSVEKRLFKGADGEMQGKDHSSHGYENSNDEEDLLTDLPADMDCKIEETCFEDYEENYQLQASNSHSERNKKRKTASGETQDVKSQVESKILTPDTLLFDFPQSSNNLNEDQDRMFLLSLLDDFKKVHESHRLDLKCDIISAIRKWQKMEPS